MELVKNFPIGFYLWWLGINGCLYFAEFHFIQNFTGIHAKKFLMWYVMFSDLLTFFVMFYQSPGILRLLLHAGIIVGFPVFCLKIKWSDAVAPAMIILTLFTFMEGFQTVFMRFLSGQEADFSTAIVIQILVSGILTVLLVVTLNYISKTYFFTGQQKISHCLYALLFPCIFIVWAIRSGLSLDMWMDSGTENLLPGNQSNLWALFWILGACAIFFIILRLAGRIVILSMQETDQKRLEDQMKEQSIYLEEAKMRNEKYRRFQHDIDNHFLVLSGLIHEKKYEEAEIYFENLHKASDHLLIGIETGNPVIDILLNEKINYARSNGIEVKYDIRFSSDCPVEDLDLCVILANAMDNAITACMKGDIEQPEISVMVCKRHHFLILEIANPVSAVYQATEYGTGLKNIRHTVEKYEGTMEIEESKNYFKLTALLCLKPFTKEEPPFAKSRLRK